MQIVVAECMNETGGIPGILPGVTTASIVCTLLQLAYNEVDIARVKYVSRMLKEAQTSPDVRPAVSRPLSPPNPPSVDEVVPRKPIMERILTALGWHPVSNEEYVEKLKYKRDACLRRIAQLEVEKERDNKPTDSS